MNCPVCGAEMRRVGLDSIQQGIIVAEYECSHCHWRVSQPLQKK